MPVKALTGEYPRGQRAGRVTGSGPGGTDSRPGRRAWLDGYGGKRRGEVCAAFETG